MMYTITSLYIAFSSVRKQAKAEKVPNLKSEAEKLFLRLRRKDLQRRKKNISI